jgi:hypothetical protein
MDAVRGTARIKWCSALAFIGCNEGWNGSLQEQGWLKSRYNPS